MPLYMKHELFHAFLWSRSVSSPQLTPPYMFRPGTRTKKICTAAGISVIESHTLLLSANILLHIDLAGLP
jgi:hypothetical protein